MYYSYKEIKKHNNINDTWLIIDGEVFDLTEFMKIHTGGKMPAYFSGSDATNMFEAIHPPYVKNILKSSDFRKKYYKGKIRNYKPLNPKKCKEIDNFTNKIWKILEKKKINSKNKCNKKIIIFNYLLIFCFIYIYYKLLNKNNYKYAILLGIIMALLVASSHEIAHYHTNKYLLFSEKILTYLVPSLSGISNHIWLKDHIIRHHQYPNQKDDDWQPILRLNYNSKCLIYNKFQILISLLLVLPLNMIGIFIADIYFYLKLFRKIENFRRLYWIISKLLITYFLYIKPFKIHGKKYLVNLIIISFISGLGSWVFNFLNHHFDETPFYNSKDCWQKEILIKSINWNSNKIINFLSFGLNKHVEHHLFPTISSCNLKYITPYLKENFAIKEKKLSVAIKDHIKYLIKCGNCN